MKSKARNAGQKRSHCGDKENDLFLTDDNGVYDNTTCLAFEDLYVVEHRGVPFFISRLIKLDSGSLQLTRCLVLCMRHFQKCKQINHLYLYSFIHFSVIKKKKLLSQAKFHVHLNFI